MTKFTSANAIALTTTAAYFVLLGIAFLWFSNMKFSGDAAGKGMAMGYTFLLGIGFFVILALILAVTNLYLQKRITITWIKYAAFVPLLVIVLIGVFAFFGRGYSASPNTTDQAHKLTFEIKSPHQLQNARYSIRTSSGGSGGKPRISAQTEGAYRYVFSTVIYKQYERSFSIVTDHFEAELVASEIPEMPIQMPISDWKSLTVASKDTVNQVQLHYRYKVEKLLD